MMKIIGIVIMSIPFVVITISMFREAGWRCVVFVWGTCLAVLLCAVAGAWCLTL